MAPTAVAVVEKSVLAWNRSELQGPLARRLDSIGIRPLELIDYRSVGEKVVARTGETTLVFTVKLSQITGLAVYEPGMTVPAQYLRP